MVPVPTAADNATGAEEHPRIPLSPQEEEALKLLRELSRQRPQGTPLRPRSGNRYVLPRDS